MVFLCTYLQHCDLPDSFQLAMGRPLEAFPACGLGRVAQASTSSLRHQLMSWLVGWPFQTGQLAQPATVGSANPMQGTKQWKKLVSNCLYQEKKTGNVQVVCSQKKKRLGKGACRLDKIAK